MMPNTMKYRDYTASVMYDDEDGLFVGDVVDLRDTITFSGSSVEELKRAFTQAVDDYIQFCQSRGEEPENPYSGRFVLRLEPSLHRRASVAAGAQQISLNSFIARAIEHELSGVGSVAIGRFRWPKAQFVQRTFSVGTQSARTIAQICRRVEGEPAQLEGWAELTEEGSVFGRGVKNVAA